MQRMKHIYRREMSAPFPDLLTQAKCPAMFFRRALVWSRYWYHVLPETLPHYPSSCRVHRDKPVGEYVGINYPIVWPPNITFGSKGRRIMSTLRPALMVPPTPDTCYTPRYQSRRKGLLRSKWKRIATIMPGQCNEQATKQHQSKQNRRGALEQKILAWRPVRVLASAIHSL